MSLEKLSFTKDWTNPADFPTYEPSESKVRADMQLLYNEIKDYLNKKVAPAVDATTEAVASVAQGGMSPTIYDPQNKRTDIFKYVDDAAPGVHDHTEEELRPAQIEFSGVSQDGIVHGGILDFHYGRAGGDYTSRIMESAAGTVTLNGGKILTSDNIIAIYNKQIAFNSGVATYQNDAITVGSVVFVQLRVGTAGGAPVIIGSTSKNGEVTICSSSASETTTRSVNILIIKP